MTSSEPDPIRGRQVRGLVEFAGKVLVTGETLLAAGSALRDYDPGGDAFGGDAPGALGELCRELGRQWSRALEARAGEAARLGDRLVGTAEGLGKAAAGYADTDITVATWIADAGSVDGPAAPEGIRPRHRSLTVRAE